MTLPATSQPATPEVTFHQTLFEYQGHIAKLERTLEALRLAFIGIDGLDESKMRASYYWLSDLVEDCQTCASVAGELVSDIDQKLRDKPDARSVVVTFDDPGENKQLQAFKALLREAARPEWLKQIEALPPTHQDIVAKFAAGCAAAAAVDLERAVQPMSPAQRERGLDVLKEIEAEEANERALAGIRIAAKVFGKADASMWTAAPARRQKPGVRARRARKAGAR